MLERSLLYGGRVKGDIDLGLEPSRLNGQTLRARARMDFPGGRVPGATDQSIYEQSETQKFDIGTRRIVNDCTFRYSKAGSALTASPRARLAANGNYVPDGAAHPNVNGFFGNLKSAAAVGSLYVDLDTATAYAANFFQGGRLCIFGTTIFHQHYIVASDVGNTNYVRCYLDEPIYIEDITIAMGVEVWCSPYINVVEGLAIQQYKSFIGLPLCGPVTINYYFWLQTRGPAFVTPMNWDTDPPGYAADSREVYAWIDGTIRGAPGVTVENGYQRVGYLLSATEATYGDAWIMLQLE